MSVNSIVSTASPTSATSTSGFAALGQEDFLRLLTTQLQMQDPFDPVDNKEMLAQMAQFSSLAGISDMGETLGAIAAKLDTLIAQQANAASIAQAGASDTGTSSPAAEDPDAASETQTETQTQV
ncbi:MAG: flagellar hook capping FlgD N-terminal domain-containing protein [Novosphingobium sp.]